MRRIQTTRAQQSNCNSKRSPIFTRMLFAQVADQVIVACTRPTAFHATTTQYLTWIFLVSSREEIPHPRSGHFRIGSKTSLAQARRRVQVGTLEGVQPWTRASAKKWCSKRRQLVAGKWEGQRWINWTHGGPRARRTGRSWKVTVKDGGNGRWRKPTLKVDHGATQRERQLGTL